MAARSSQQGQERHAKSTPGALRDSQNRPKNALGSVPGNPEAPKELPGTIRSVFDAPRERPGSARRVPKSVPVKNRSFFGVPRGARKRAEAINFDADSPPRSEKSSFCRTAGSRRLVGAIFRRCLSIFGFFAKCEISVSYHACRQKQRFGPWRCESSRSRAATSKNTKIGSQIDPKSSKIASRGRSGGLLGRLLSLEAPRSSASIDCCRSAEPE